jgi:hypothetical protein
MTYNERLIRMNTTLAAEGNSLNFGEENLVSEGLAIALCTLPEDSPRAEPVGWAIRDGKAVETAETPARGKETATAPRRGRTATAPAQSPDEPV